MPFLCVTERLKVNYHRIINDTRDYLWSEKYNFFFFFKFWNAKSNKVFRFVSNQVTNYLNLYFMNNIATVDRSQSKTLYLKKNKNRLSTVDVLKTHSDISEGFHNFLVYFGRKSVITIYWVPVMIMQLKRLDTWGSQLCKKKCNMQTVRKDWTVAGRGQRSRHQSKCCTSRIEFCVGLRKGSGQEL